ncbi:MAG TPA: flavodoxin family protein [Dehalococcoidales bacterium]
MYILGISGSPRKGNTEWMLNKLMESAAESGADIETLLLRKMDVRLCRGCLSCEEGGRERKGICVIKDDMTEVYPKLLKADAIVLASPGYFGMLSGLLKSFLDRTTPVWPHLEGKQMAGLAFAEEGTGQTIQNFKHYALLCKMHWTGSVSVLAKLPGEVAQNNSIEPRLKRLAQKLVFSLG